MTFTDVQVMLTLAGLTYRGFQDVLPGEPHEFVVRRALQRGLGSLVPVKDDWELVWGPVTSRVPLAAFDSSAMYVVRKTGPGHRHRYVVAIRGTNPVASSDWLFGDLLVGTTVRWPYASDEAAISTSTALGLAMLQDMRSRGPSTAARFAEASAEAVGGALDDLVLSARALISGTTEARAAHRSSLETQVKRIIDHWKASDTIRDGLRDRLQRAKSSVHLDPATLRRKLLPAGPGGAGLDLLTFLRTQTDDSSEPLEVTVTGHSKGGALAPTVALWLKDALDSMDPGECWDTRRRAQVRAYAYAGPTPGNAMFADRIERTLGKNYHHVRNRNDIVTHAWQVDELQEIPGLYGRRTAPFRPLVSRIVAGVQDLGYRHARADVTPFAGALDADRSLPAEFIHQHLDAYLENLELRQHGIEAVTFFI